MTPLAPLPATFAATRDALQRVGVHIVARARQQATGRFGLRVTPGGFGTPEFGPDLTRVRVSGALLVRETGGSTGATNRAAAIDGATLADLAMVADVDLDAALDVGHDTPPLGDRSSPLAVDAAAADALARWYLLAATALDRVVVASLPQAGPTLAQLWPEHFDVALDLAAVPDRRANLGASPGDGFHPEPYLYVGPWTDDRPGDSQFWNVPFGAVLGYADIVQAGDPVSVSAAFFERGIDLLSQ
jgi:hypothetical protein